MDKIQEIEFGPKRNNLLLAVHGLNIFLLCLNFALNFLGEPSLKYLYLAQVFFIFATIISFDFVESFPEILILFFIEGQGRVLWEYQSWARIVFDLLTLLAILKIFIVRKKIFEKQFIPWPVLLFISLHFLWYIVELFNVYSASVFGAVAASKIYIFPIFLFLALLLSGLDFKSKQFQTTLNLFLFIIIAEIGLNYYQLMMKQNLLLGISQYYFKAMRDGVFVNNLFRPFGTGALPGAISIFLFTTVGLLFIRKTKTKGTLLRLAIIGASSYTILICQVRSAFVKYLLIIGLIELGLMFYERFKPAKILPVFLIGIILAVGGKTFLLESDTTGDDNLDYAKQRMSSLADMNKLKSSRLNVEDFSQIAWTKLADYPLGLGPGMTGAASSINKEELTFNPLINKNMLWTMDNLFISLFIDLGVGAIFYILLIFSIPVYFFRYLLTFYSKKMEENFRLLLICMSTLVVILIGNWGAVGLTYNPESFAFWFFAAGGFKIIYSYKLGVEGRNIADKVQV